jgi:CPA1 family monovalent cation:H+ antiporter
VFLTFVAILATLVGQGLTLPFVIRRLGVGGDRSIEGQELEARRVATEAALARLDELETEVPGHRPLIDELREEHRHRVQHFDRARDGDADAEDTEQREHEEIRRSVLDAQRSAVIAMRDRGEISHQALRRVERDIDLVEVRGDA